MAASPTHTVEFTVRQTEKPNLQIQFWLYKLGIPRAIRHLRREQPELQYLYILEQHRNGGLHAHCLFKGQDIPHAHLREAAIIARLGPITWIQRIETTERAIRYAAKHLTKAQQSEQLALVSRRRIHRSRRFLDRPVREYRQEYSEGYKLVEVVASPPNRLRPWGEPRAKPTYAFTLQPQDIKAPMVKVRISAVDNERPRA